MFRFRRGLPLALLLTACTAGPPPPAEPGTPRPWSDPQWPGVRLALPANWTARTVTKDQARLLMVEATPAERLVLTRVADGTELPAEALAAKVSAAVARQFPDTRILRAAATTVAGRPAVTAELALAGGSRGQRTVVQGGWVIEYEYRAANEGLATSFEAVVKSLELTGQ